jgi:hypothetical protein
MDVRAAVGTNFNELVTNGLKRDGLEQELERELHLPG